MYAYALEVIRRIKGHKLFLQFSSWCRGGIMNPLPKGLKPSYTIIQKPPVKPFS